MTVTLRPEQLTRERFVLYGDVVEAAIDRKAAMNAARFERFEDLCNVDIEDDGRVGVSIARCRVATSLPHRIDTVERHPLGSQAFIPLTPCKFIVVVAPPEESVEVADLRAFVTNGRQGINYHRGTWHMPLIGFDVGQEFLIVDRAPGSPNCDEHSLDEAVMLVEA